MISTHEFIIQRNFDKCRISAIYQPAEQKLLDVENIFKDTVDLRECTSENSLNGLFRVQPNYETMKRKSNEVSIKFALGYKEEKYV